MVKTSDVYINTKIDRGERERSSLYLYLNTPLVLSQAVKLQMGTNDLAPG